MSSKEYIASCPVDLKSLIELKIYRESDGKPSFEISSKEDFKEDVRLSNLVDNLKNMIRFEESATGYDILVKSLDDINSLCLGKLENVNGSFRLVSSDKTASENQGEIDYGMLHKLTSYEVKLLAKNTLEELKRNDIFVPFSRDLMERLINENLHPKTDLHTHLNGVLSAKEILDIALENDAVVSDEMFERMRTVILEIDHDRKLKNSKLYKPAKVTEPSIWTTPNFRESLSNVKIAKGEILKNLKGKTYYKLREVLGTEGNRTEGQQKLYDTLIKYMEIPSYLSYYNQNPYYGLRSYFILFSPQLKEDIDKTFDIKTKDGKIYKFKKFEKFYYDTLKEIALKYKKMGVNYTELSCRVNKSFTFDLMDKCVDLIEKETGVKLRFLISVSKGHGVSSLLDVFKTISNCYVQKKEDGQLLHSRYFVGFDMLGYEKDDILKYSDEIGLMAIYAMKCDQNFVMRIHAGEVEKFLDTNSKTERDLRNNILNTLRIVDRVNHSLSKMYGHKLPYPKIRIGHGIYFDDINKEELFNLMRKMGVVVEINATSNLTLENAEDFSKSPIAEYIRNGVNVVLGTDGGEFYSTDILQEYLVATQKLTYEEVKKMLSREEQYLSKLKDLNDSDYQRIFDFMTKKLENGQTEVSDCISKVQEVGKELRG